MTGKDLLIGLGDISHKYYEEAENDTIGSAPKYKTLRRPLMIAAILALTALLVGCAVVYALRLQDMSIGQETYTQNFADDGRAIEPTEKTRDIITLYGHSGDSIQLALKEWHDFLETYDPDGDLMDNNPDHAEIPNRYEYTYGCYTQDMVNKVDEIAAKYDLKLLEEWLPFQAWQSDIFLEETGIDAFLLPDSGAEVSGISGMYYPPYNFSMDFELSTDKLDAKIWGDINYARKDYFPWDSMGGLDLSQFEQWDYMAQDGTPLLLALSSKGVAYIIAEQENAMMILRLDGNYSRSAYPTADEIMTKSELETVADLFDYSIQVQKADRTVLEQKLEESQDAYDAAHTYVPETYGNYNDYLKINIQIYDDALQYTFYDLSGDGEEDLLIGVNGAMDSCLFVEDEEVHAEVYGQTYICENGILENYMVDEIFETHSYVIPNFEINPGEDNLLWTTVQTVKRTRDQWMQILPGEFKGKEITTKEAQEIMAQYTRIELDWKPLMEYPLADGYTMGDYLNEKDVRVSKEELREIYRDYLLDKDDLYYSHYRILDINCDGVDDLLLKGENDSLLGNTDFYWIALTYRYGGVYGFASDFYLCEDSVLESVGTRRNLGIGVEVNGHQFKRCIGFEEELLEFVAYNKATASWMGDWWEDIPLTDEEANAILAKYPRIDQGMRPISELLG